MKTILKNILLAMTLGTTVSLSSCSSDFMDVTPTDQYSEDVVFSDAALTQSFINTIYGYVRHGAGEHAIAAASDEAYFTHNYGMKAVNETAVSESDLQWFDDGNCPFRWYDAYKGIRYANLALSKIDEVPVTSGYDNGQMKGEAYFLRAYIYAQLVRGFGGVPIVTKVYGLNDVEEMQQPRNNVKECVDFILADCEEAIKLLPVTVSDANLGRATKGAAMALKARILLQIASPLYFDKTVNTLDVNQYNGDQKALYTSARQAALDVINSGTYKLIDCNAGTVEATAEKFHKIILDPNNEEKIFTRQFAQKGSTNWLVLQHGPNGYHNWSGVTPTQDLVQNFEMADGTLLSGFDKVGDTKTVNPYLNREPRFYATIGFDGCVWGRIRPADAYPLDPTPLGQLQTGYYEITGVESEVSIKLPPSDTKLEFKGLNGIDTREGPIEDWNGSWTGYYERKLVDTSVDGQNYAQNVPWTYLRLAEMYLIAAEASVELDELEDAVNYLDALRARIGMPDTKTTLTRRGKAFNQAEMREFVRHERLVELAFEDHRYFDVRRWMIAPEINKRPLTGVLVFGRLKPGMTQAKPYIHNEEKYNYTYIVKDLSYRENRAWDNKMYFAPIKQAEIRRNPSLKQNPGME
ncbi:MAG: RagB/SusD family nutrient uptake outer membrane protein [Parabacteroides sp.]|nr:RagB/SusD family nutrient uptake outer membrane protein [Parabacteroides sp.]